MKERISPQIFQNVMKRIIKKYLKKTYANKCGNLEEMNQFLEIY